MIKTPQNITTEKEIVAQDEMSQISKLTITIPATGGPGLEAALSEIAELAGRGPLRSLSAAKLRISADVVTDTQPLSKGDFFEKAKSELAKAEKALDLLPVDYREQMKEALDHAFRAGSLLTEEFMRETHLPDVRREAGQKKDRRRGGFAKKGKVKKDTEEIVHEMIKLIKDGKSKSSAAAVLHRRGFGTSADANRKRYDGWMKRKPEV